MSRCRNAAKISTERSKVGRKYLMYPHGRQGDNGNQIHCQKYETPPQVGGRYQATPIFCTRHAAAAPDATAAQGKASESGTTV